jgi:hypothetical protein
VTKIVIEKLYDGDYSVKVKSDDGGMFRLGIDTLKSFISAPSRSYDPHEKRWIIAGLAQTSFIRWLDYCRVNLKAEIQWLDPDASGQSEKTWTPPPPLRHPTSADAYAALFLLPQAPPEVVKAAYRALSLKHHPDRQGDVVEMQKLNAAYQFLSKQVAA